MGHGRRASHDIQLDDVTTSIATCSLRSSGSSEGSPKSGTWLRKIVCDASVVCGRFADRMFEMSVDLRSREGDAGDVAGVELIEEIAVGNRGRPVEHFNDAEDGESHQDDAENPYRRAHVPWPGAVMLNRICHLILLDRAELSLLDLEQRRYRPLDLIEDQRECGRSDKYRQHEPPRQRRHQGARQGQHRDDADVGGG